MSEKRKLKVFLCHSWDDKPRVRELYNRLVADGYDVWVDEEKLLPGQDWDLEIRKAVRASDVVAVCLSSISVSKSGYVQKEIRFAMDAADEKPPGTIFIIPVRLEVCDVPDRISRYQWVDLFEANGYTRLKEGINLRTKDLNIRFDSTAVSPKTGGKGIQIPLLGSITNKLQLLDEVAIANREYKLVDVASDLLPSRTENLFALEIGGASTKDAMMSNGDVVILEKASKVQDGEMAIIRLPDSGDAMLKYYYEDRTQHRLLSGNPDLGPVFISKSSPFEIRGKVMMFIHRQRIDSRGFSLARDQITLIKQRKQEAKSEPKPGVETPQAPAKSILPAMQAPAEQKPSVEIPKALEKSTVADVQAPAEQKPGVEIPRAPEKSVLPDIQAPPKQPLVLFEPKLVQIPAGRFFMGTSKEQAERIIQDGGDEVWISREFPQHAVDLPEYWIGKYPITNQQYQEFLNDTHYSQPREWRANQFPSGKQNHPVVNVRWKDAAAYCDWLSSKSGKKYRLPTEEEWEKAARGGGDRRLYPWGDQFDPALANTSETRMDTTSEVGKFSPRGDSPYGCADLAGNVWEWTSTVMHSYPDARGGITVFPHGVFVRRGGSFYNSFRNATCTYRNWYRPDDFYFNIGFRVVVSE